MNRRKVTIVFMLVVTILLSSFSFYGYQILFSANFLVEGERRILIIEEDETFKSLQNKLYDDEYVNDLVSFSFLSRLMDYDALIKPGRYTIEPNMTNLEVIRLLRAGNQTPVRITFNNVRLISDLGEKITANLLISPEDFSVALMNFINKNEQFN